MMLPSTPATSCRVWGTGSGFRIGAGETEQKAPGSCWRLHERGQRGLSSILALQPCGEMGSGRRSREYLQPQPGWSHPLGPGAARAGGDGSVPCRKFPSATGGEAGKRVKKCLVVERSRKHALRKHARQRSEETPKFSL